MSLCFFMGYILAINSKSEGGEKGGGQGEKVGGRGERRRAREKGGGQGRKGESGAMKERS